jgi:hypothetical protein
MNILIYQTCYFPNKISSPCLLTNSTYPKKMKQLLKFRIMKLDSINNDIKALFCQTALLLHYNI